MHRFPIRFLLFLSAAVILFSCNHYRHMQKVQSDNSCISKFKPDFNYAVYKTVAVINGKEISGILMIKKMPDSSIRIVFSSQMGLSFFDFGFLPENQFQVYQILPGMNKKAIIKTLRKDFELVMFRNMDSNSNYSLADSNQIYHAYPQFKGINYYITDDRCQHLIKMQRASNKKPVMEAFTYMDSSGTSPDSIFIHHLNFNFMITLKKTTPLAPE